MTAKSSVVFDVSPLEDSTDMHELEQAIRDIDMDGLEWKGCMDVV